VRAGGGFGMIGGYMSFGGIGGRAHYHQTAIEETLPVTILPFDDRVEVPEGVVPSVIDPTHPLLEGINSPWPSMLGYNRVICKPTAHLVLNCADDPLVVTGSFGAGRALAFTSDCAPHWGSSDFVNWPGYGVFWLNAVAWLEGGANSN
jgi:uncharacterized membrane protein